MTQPFRSANASLRSFPSAQLDDAAFAEAWEQGRKLTVGEAVTLALEAETDRVLYDLKGGN